MKRSLSRWPFVALALAVLGGGVATGVVLSRDKQPAGYQAKNRFDGVKLTAGKLDGKVLVETTANLTPDEIVDAYKDALVELLAFEPAVSAERDVIEEIVAVPQATLCEPSITRASEAPCAPADTFTTALRGEKRQLLVVDDRARLAATLRAGLAQAVCDFQFLYLTGSDDVENARRSEQICAMAKRFIGQN